MKFEYKDVLPFLTKWARYYCRRFPRFEEYELFNVAYTGRIQELEDANMISLCIKRDILNYITYELKRSAHLDVDRIYDALVAVDGTEAEMDRREVLDNIIDEAGLDTREKQIVFMHFYCGVSLKDIARTLNVNHTRVSQILKALLDRLRSIYVYQSKEDI